MPLMSLRKAALLFVSGMGLYSVANYSAEVANARDRKKVLQGKPFWLVGHRGFAGKYPENTMHSFEQALALPIDAIELDVHSSRDGRVVVIHDQTVDRTTNGTGRVFDMQWNELRKLDAGYNFDPGEKHEYPFRGKGLTIPLLEEVFQKIGEKKIIIEIKQTLPAIEELVYGLIRKYQMQEKVIVASEHYEPLVRFRILDPSIATNLSAKEATDFYKMYRLRLSNFYRGNGDALQIPEKHNGNQIVTPAFVQSSHRRGFALHIWTVNDPSDMQRLIEDGVDGIITDFPDRLIQVVEQMNGHRTS